MATKESVIIGQFKATKAQAEYLKGRALYTGESQASILRALLQKDMSNESK